MWQSGQATTTASRAEGLRPFKDAAGKAGGDVAAGNAHGCAAAFRLQGERHDFGARAVMMLSMAIGFSASSNRMMSAGRLIRQP